MEMAGVYCCQSAVIGGTRNCNPISLVGIQNSKPCLHFKIQRSPPHFPGIGTGHIQCQSVSNSIPRASWLLMAGAQGFGELDDGGGGDGFKSDTVNAIPVDDVTILHVEGMSCGHCVASVKRILEGLPQVASATVNLDTAEAVVWTVPEARVTKDWQQELGDIIANHLTNGGFKSTVKGNMQAWNK